MVSVIYPALGTRWEFELVRLKRARCGTALRESTSVLPRLNQISTLIERNGLFTMLAIIRRLRSDLNVSTYPHGRLDVFKRYVSAFCGYVNSESY